MCLNFYLNDRCAASAAVALRLLLSEGQLNGKHENARTYVDGCNKRLNQGACTEPQARMVTVVLKLQ